MATITAKTGSSSIPMNVLDPNTWIGGVVPGVNDIAIFPHHPFTQQFYFPDAASSIVTPYISYIAPWSASLDGQVRIRLYGNTGFPAISGSFLFKPGMSYKNYVKVDYRFLTGTSTNTYLHSCSIDRTYSDPTMSVVPGNNWIISGSLIGNDNYAFGLMINSNAGLIPFTASGAQSGSQSGPMMYELTGSQQWAVGTVRMGDHNQFVIKDSSKLILATGSTPCVDFNTTSTNWSSLIVQDNGIIEVSSSLKNNVQGQLATGVYLGSSGGNYVLISGSATYSSSILTADSAVGSNKVTVANPAAFDVGDWISLEDDIALTAEHNLQGAATTNFITTGNVLFTTGSKAYKPINYVDMGLSGSPDTNEVVRVEKIAGNDLYVSKKLGKTGYIHQDLGTFTYKELAEAYQIPVDYFDGSKRAILVETNHHAFKQNDWVACDNGVYRVISSIAYLSQSKFVDFTKSATNAANVFCKSIYAFSGSGYSGATTTPTYADSYFAHQFMASGSRNGKYSFYLNSASVSNNGTAANYETAKGYMRSSFFISGSYFKEGEIELSGSVVQSFTQYSGSLNEQLGLVWNVKPGQREDYQLHNVEYGASYYPTENNAFGVRGDGALYVNVDGAANIQFDGFIFTSGSTKIDYYNDNDFFNQIASFTRPNEEVNLKVVVRDGYTELFAQGVSVGKWISTHDAGGVAVQMRRYASLFSVSIKNLYDLILLDTEDAITPLQDLREAGLMESHTVGTNAKWWATEIEDELGFKNLVWDYWDKKGQTGIMPYLHSFTFASASINTCQQYLTAYYSARFLDFSPTYPVAFTQPFNATAAGANWLTVDMGTSCTFDTIGIVPAYGSGYQTSENGYASAVTGWANVMKSIRFEVSDTPDNWQEVYATQDDLRISAGSSAIRFYTFPSGSVTKRFIRYHNAGGTQSSNYTSLSYFGVYNQTSIPGYASSSQNQIKLKSVKNLNVGDSIMVWSKQFGYSVRNTTLTGTNAGAAFNSLNTNVVLGATSANNLLSGSYGVEPVSGSNSFGVTGGYKRGYDIIAISGSVVTLDRPISCDFIGKGTLVMKVNRGSAKLQKNVFNDRCGIYSYNTTNIVNIKNAEVDGYIYNLWPSNVVITPTLTLLDDMGQDWGNDTAGVYMQSGYAKNVVTNAGISTTSYRYQNLISSPIVIYNTFQRLASVGSLQHVPNQLSVYNHNVFATYADVITNDLNTSYPFPQWTRNKTYIKNNFFDSYTNMHHFYNAINEDGTPDLLEFTNNSVATVSHNNSGKSSTWYTQIPLTDTRYTNPYFNQHIAPNITFASARGRCSYVTTTGGNITEGLLVHDAPALNGRSAVYIGSSITAYTIILKDPTGTWNDVVFANTEKNISLSTTANTTDLGCIFDVKSESTVNLDLSFDFKMSPFTKYAYNPTYPLYYGTGYTTPKIVLINNRTSEVLDSVEIKSLTEINVVYNKQLTLKPGTYSLVMAWTTPYATQIGMVSWSYKNMNFNIITDTPSNVTVTKNTWDIHKLLENNSLEVNKWSRPNTIGAPATLRVSNNLSTTTKFNNVRL